MPPTETGRYADWPGFIGTCKMMLPVGIVNACDPRQAALDALDTGRLKDSPHRAFNYALEVCAAVAAACAEALRPGATVEAIISEALRHLSSVPRAEVEAALAWTGEVEDVGPCGHASRPSTRGAPSRTRWRYSARGWPSSAWSRGYAPGHSHLGKLWARLRLHLVRSRGPVCRPERPGRRAPGLARHRGGGAENRSLYCFAAISGRYRQGPLPGRSERAGRSKAADLRTGDRAVTCARTTRRLFGRIPS